MPVRILIIEDDPASLELTTYLLESAGHEVASAVDGVAGLVAVRAKRPDLVICDLQLPLMDGYSVARNFKADPAIRQIPVIAVTALSMPGDEERSLAAGFDGFLTKPISPETFVATIESFLPAQLRSGG